MKRNLYLCFFIICLWHTCSFGQTRTKVNGVYYNEYETAYLSCTSFFNVRVEVWDSNSSTWLGTLVNLYGTINVPSGWSYTLQPSGYDKTNIDFSSSLPSNSGLVSYDWSIPFVGSGTAHIYIQTTPQLNWTSTPTISGSYSSNTYSVYAATSGNINWSGYGGVQINGSGSYCCGQNATVSTQAYGGLVQVTASNSCGTSPAITYIVGTPYIQNTTVNGSNGSSATVSWVATLALLTNGTASGANWAVTNGSGSISASGTSCNAYPSSFLRVVGTATNSNGSGQDATFYIFKDGYSAYRMAYPNPTRDQLTLTFDDPIIAQELLKEVSLVDEKGKVWAGFDMAAAKETNYFSQAKNITLNVKQLPTGTYYLQVQLGEKRSSERILIQ